MIRWLRWFTAFSFTIAILVDVTWIGEHSQSRGAESNSNGEIVDDSAQLSEGKTIEVWTPDGGLASGAVVTFLAAKSLEKFTWEDLGPTKKLTTRNGSIVCETDMGGEFPMTTDANQPVVTIWHKTGWYMGWSVDLADKVSVQLKPWNKVQFTNFPVNGQYNGDLLFTMQFDMSGVPPISVEIPIHGKFNDGRLSVDFVPNGQMQLTRKKRKTLSDEQSVSFRVEPARELSIPLSGKSTVRGTIQQKGTGKAESLDGWHIGLISLNKPGDPTYSVTTQISQDNSFEFNELVAGQYYFAIASQESDLVKNGGATGLLKERPRYSLSSSLETRITVPADREMDVGVVDLHLKLVDTQSATLQLDPYFETIVEDFVPTVRPRFVIKTGRPRWNKLGDSPSEKIQFLDGAGKVVREFGNVYDPLDVPRFLVDNQGGIFGIHLGNNFCLFELSGKQFGRITNVTLRGGFREPILTHQGNILFNRSQPSSGQLGNTWSFTTKSRVLEHLNINADQIARVLEEKILWGYRKGEIFKTHVDSSEVMSVPFLLGDQKVRGIQAHSSPGGCWLALVSSRGREITTLSHLDDQMRVNSIELVSFFPIRLLCIDSDAYVYGVENKGTEDEMKSLVRVDSTGKECAKLSLVDLYDVCVDPEGRGLWIALDNELARVSIDDGAMQIVERVPNIQSWKLMVLPTK